MTSVPQELRMSVKSLIRVPPNPPRFKTLLGAVATVGPTGQADVMLRFSLQGATGGYMINVSLLGVVVTSFEKIAVVTSVSLVVPVQLPGLSEGLCGRQYHPVCRHAGGVCSFGNVSGQEPRIRVQP